MRGLGAVVVVVAGCYHPSLASDQPCTADLMCPIGETCDTQRTPPTCVGTITPNDSAMVDMMIDAPSTLCGACTPAAPVCDTGTLLCRACQKDAECGSNVCGESTGRCIDAGMALYVTMGGSDANTCTKGAPCASVSRAATLLDATHATIKVGDGTYTDTILTAGSNYLLSGEGNTRFGAKINFEAGVAGRDHVLEVQGGTVVVEGLTFQNAAAEENIRAQGGANVTLWRCQVSAAAKGNVDMQASSVTVIESRITGGQGAEAAFNTSGGTLTIQRSMIDHNAGGGILVSSAKFDIENSFIVVNGGLGGFVQQGTLPGTAKLALDTFADNTATATAGMTCALAVNVSSSIFSNNGSPQIGATCTATYSLFTDAAVAGTGNVFIAAPGFVGGGDYHLLATSPAIDIADPATPAQLDYDNEHRPHGAHSDMGADEQY